MNKILNTLSIILIFSATGLITNVTKNAIYDKHIIEDQNIFPFINKVEGINKLENIQEVEISPNNEVYAWNENNLFRSHDGQSFKNIFTSQITTIGIKNNDIYVGTTFDLFKSDTGDSYVEVSETFYGKEIFKIVVTTNGTMYVATNQGLYQSSDCINFIKISNLIITNLVVSETGVIYTIHDNYLDKSIDGKDWINILKDEKNNLTCLSVGLNGEICLVADEPNNNYLYRINDVGAAIKITPNLGIINKVEIIATGAIILATEKGLYQSFAQNKFTLYLPYLNRFISWFTLDLNKQVYVATPTQGLYVINLLHNLLSVNNPDYDSAQYNGTLMYNTPQYIGLKSYYLTKAVLNGETLVIPTTNLRLNNGKYSLALTVKQDYRNFISIFGGDVNTGIITYNFEIKDNISNQIVKYSTSADNTILEQGLVSNFGNTRGCEIIQTRDKSYLGEHQAQLKIDINDQKENLIDYSKSYYIAGEIIENVNNFIIKGDKQIVSQHLIIKKDGIYQLHLVDLLGNIYNSYLELGAKNNNKLYGSMTDPEVVCLANKLNVSIWVYNPNEKTNIMKWLQTYQNIADEQFNNSVRHCGKGFHIKIKDLPDKYKTFLNPVTYFNMQSSYSIDRDKLIKVINDLASKQLKKELKNLANEQLNVDSRNVVDKKTLDKFSIWFNNYQNFLDNNKNAWINKISRVATRGFGTTKQINFVKDSLATMKNFNNRYLKKIVWDANLLNTNFDYSKLIKVEDLENDTIENVNMNFPELNKIYLKYLNNSINQINMHGYKVNKILDNNELPQTKEEIDNYDGNQNFTQWLQEKVNTKFHKWQLIIGLSIGVPLLLIISVLSLYFYWRYTEKYHPRPYKIYKRLQKIDQQRFKQKKIKKNFSSE